MMKYLNARGIEIINREVPLEITNDEELVADIAGVWKTSNEGIRAVIQARCDILTNKLVFDCLPYEVPIIRQTLIELGGILEDFEKISQEFNSREEIKNKK